MSYAQQCENSTDEFASSTWNDDEWGNADPDNPNYIDWITYDIRQIPEYKDCEYSFKDNNDFAITPKENTFTNENQNNIDILNESSQCNYNNIISKKNNNMPQLSKILLEEDNISAEDPSDLHELISEEDSEKLDKEILKKINKLNQQEEKLNQQELLLQNEERELELKIKKEKQKLKLLLKNENQELLEKLKPNDNMRNKKRNGLIKTAYKHTGLPLYFNKKYPKRQYINNVVYIAKEEKGIYDNLSGFKP